jgi:tetratricopeptide (TPR) repeat protein
MSRRRRQRSRTRPKPIRPPSPGRADARPSPRTGVRIALGLLAASAIASGLLAWLNRDRTTAGPPHRSAVAAPDDPGDVGAWLALLDRLRVEERPIEAMETGWAAYRAVSPRRRPEILRSLTLALLADVPEGQAVASLRGRIEEDPGDLDARVALLRRSIASEAVPADRPRIGRSAPSDPDALPSLLGLLDRSPGHPGARDAAIEALLNAGRIDEARARLDAWPESFRDDPRRLRIESRMDLDVDARPDRARRTLSRLLDATPHDWKLRSNYSRALEMLGDRDGARREALLVDRLRDQLAPDRLGPKLAEDLRRLDDPEALASLSEICASVGLAELADAWEAEAEALRSIRGLGPGRAAMP